MRSSWPLVCGLVVAALGCSPRTRAGAAGVVGSPSAQPATSAPPPVSLAPAPRPPPYGIRPDGRVDVTAREAGVQPPRSPLAADRLARACERLAACVPDTLAAWSLDEGRFHGDARLAALACPRIVQWFEERAVPVADTNEAPAFLVDAIERAPAGCDGVRAAATERTAFIVCSETGCGWDDERVPEIRCEGSVARFAVEGRSLSRDCARALASCDERSRTGCTDRAPVACDARGLDRCDGDVKLGCDRDGKVSVHDCARVAARCVEGPRGAACAPR